MNTDRLDQSSSPRVLMIGTEDVDMRIDLMRELRDEFTLAAAGKPWEKHELEKGGTFLSMTPQHGLVCSRLTLTWDVTQAVQDALKDGRTTVSLLIRAECTGPYCLGQGYKFCGPEWTQVEHRPRLRLISNE